MADDTVGFRDDGFARHGAVRFGWNLPGIVEDMDGCFAMATGGNQQIRADRLMSERVLASRFVDAAVERPPPWLASKTPPLLRFQALSSP